MTPTEIVASLKLIQAGLLIQPTPRITFLTYNYTWPFVSAFAPLATTTQTWGIIVSAAGGGMGTGRNFSFNDTTNPIPYASYGEMGGSVASDILAPLGCTLSSSVFTKTAHGLLPNQCIFCETADVITGGPEGLQPYHVHGETLTANTFKLADKPFQPPGLPPFPHVPKVFTGSGAVTLKPFRLTLNGGCGGGPIGDQGGGNGPIFIDPNSQSWAFAPKSGDCIYGGGGPGGSNPFGAGGIAQQGTLEGNHGNFPGGGGSAGGMGTPMQPVTLVIGGTTYTLQQAGMAEQVGGAGGTSGGWGIAFYPKPASGTHIIRYFCGRGGLGGPPFDIYGYPGGYGADSMMLFLEF